MFSLIFVCVIILIIVSAFGMHQENKIKLARTRRYDLMKKQSKAVVAIDEMLANKENLPLTHFVIAQMHLRMMKSLTYMIELSHKMSLSQNYRVQIANKHHMHQTSYHMHMQHAEMEMLNTEIPFLDFSGSNVESSMHAALRISRLLLRCGDTKVSEYDRLRQEINRMNSLAFAFKVSKLKKSADVLFETDAYAQATQLYMKLISLIENEACDDYQHWFSSPYESAKLRLEVIASSGVREKDVYTDDCSGDGLERFFDTKKVYRLAS